LCHVLLYWWIHFKVLANFSGSFFVWHFLLFEITAAQYSKVCASDYAVNRRGYSLTLGISVPFIVESSILSSIKLWFVEHQRFIFICYTPIICSCSNCSEFSGKELLFWYDSRHLMRFYFCYGVSYMYNVLQNTLFVATALLSGNMIPYTTRDTYLSRVCVSGSLRVPM